MHEKEERQVRTRKLCTTKGEEENESASKYVRASAPGKMNDWGTKLEKPKERALGE